MSIKESIDALIEVIHILASWPLVIMYLALIFRRHINGVFPMLGRRIRKISGGGISIELESLESPELQQIVMSRAEELEIDVPDEAPPELLDESVDEDGDRVQTGESESLVEELVKLRQERSK